MSNIRYKQKSPKTSKQIQKKESSRKKNKSAISGFATLTQVAGIPTYREHHSSIPILPVKTVKEPGIICSICGEKIDTIATAVTNPKGEYVHFDCALAEIKEHERPNDNQTISYIGCGNFGLCEKNSEGKWTILKTISYESSEKNKAIKAYVEGLKS